MRKRKAIQKHKVSPSDKGDDREGMFASSSGKDHSNVVLEMSKTATKAKTKLEYCTTSDTDSETVDPSTQTRTKSLSELQPPACLPVQASVFANSPMPRVPAKAAVLTINDDDDDDEEELSHDNHTPAVKNVLISDDLFHDIPRRRRKDLGKEPFRQSKTTENPPFITRSVLCLISQMHLPSILNKPTGLIMPRSVIFFPILFAQIFQPFDRMINIHHSNSRSSPIFIVDPS